MYFSVEGSLEDVFGREKFWRRCGGRVSVTWFGLRIVVSRWFGHFLVGEEALGRLEACG